MKLTNFKFIEKEKLWYTLSIVLILIGLTVGVLNIFNSKPALNYGIDFIGGNTFLIKLEESNPYFNNTNNDLINKIRNELDLFELKNSQIQLSSNNEVFIKTLKVNKDLTSDIIKKLKKEIGNFQILEIDFIGPSIGNELKKQSFWIITIVSLLLLLYITFRFELSYGIAALTAVLHDGLIILSFASFLNLEINTTFIAAILTVLGYSINDTIVIFDRIRENTAHITDQTLIKKLTNESLNQTLLRTLNTSLTTLIVIMSLIIFGGSTIKEFSIVLLIGIISGTYSSLCIASPVFVKINKSNT